MATGPVQPAAGDDTHWDADTQAAVPVVQPADARAERSAADFKALDDVDRRAPWRLAHMMVVVAVAAVVIWLARLLVYVAILVLVLIALSSVLVLFAGVMGAGIIFARRRYARQDSLLSVLAIAAERQIPLAPAIAAFADQFRGLSHRRIMNLTAQLNWGTALPAALGRAGKLVSRDANLLAWVGEETGTLPRALRIAATTRSTMLPIWTAIAARLSYILALLLAMQTISGFICYFIIPKFEAIFYDFAIPLPQVTVWSIEASHFAVRYAFVWVPVLISEVGLLMFLPLSFWGWGNVHIPLLDRLLGRRHTALVLRSLSLAVAGTKPISTGLQTLATHYPTAWMRRRLVRVLRDVQAGADWIDSLRYRRVIRAADAEVIRSAAAVNNLSWALGELADATDRRLAVRASAIVQTFFPLAVIMLGIVVFLMAIGYFTPLVRLITELAGA